MEEKVTIYTLAEQLNLSVSTVSRAFNPASRLSAETRQKVLEAAQRYGYQPNKSASRLSRREIRIGILIHGQLERYREAYYEETLRGFHTAEEMLHNYKVQVDLREVDVEPGSQETVLEILREFADKKLDGVITQGRLSAEMTAVLHEMKENGAQIAMIQNAAKGNAVNFCSSVDVETSAKIAAQLLAMLTRGTSGNVVVFTGAKVYFHYELLGKAFACAAAAEGLHVLQQVDTQDDPERAAALVEELFQKSETIDGIYITSANSAPIGRYLEKTGRGKSVAVVATDLYEEMYGFLERGTVDACIYQNPFEQARTALEWMYRRIAEDEMTPEQVLIAPQIVLRSNLDHFRKKNEKAIDNSEWKK